MLEQKTGGAVKTVYFIALATMMYYFLTQGASLPIYITFRHLFALLIVASAFVCFLVRPDLPRAVSAGKTGGGRGSPPQPADPIKLGWAGPSEPACGAPCQWQGPTCSSLYWG